MAKNIETTEQDKQVQAPQTEVVQTPQSEVVNTPKVEEKEEDPVVHSLYPIEAESLVVPTDLSEVPTTGILPARHENLRGADVSELVEEDFNDEQRELFEDLAARGIQEPVSVVLSSATHHLEYAKELKQKPFKVADTKVVAILVGGNTRFRMAQLLGIKEIPVKVESGIKDGISFVTAARSSNKRVALSASDRFRSEVMYLEAIERATGIPLEETPNAKIAEMTGFAASQVTMMMVAVRYKKLKPILAFSTYTYLLKMLQAATAVEFAEKAPKQEYNPQASGMERYRKMAANKLADRIPEDRILEQLRDFVLPENSKKSNLSLNMWAILTGLGTQINGVSKKGLAKAMTQFEEFLAQSEYLPQDFDGYVMLKAQPEAEDTETSDTKTSDQSNDSGGDPVKSFDLGAKSGAPTAGTSRKTTPNKVVVSNFLREIGISEEHVAVVSVFVASLYEPRGDAETALAAAFDASTSEALTNLLGAIYPANLNGKKAE